MNDAKGYFQFPVCLLALKGQWRDVLNNICGYSVARYIEVTTETPLFWQKWSNPQIARAYEKANESLNVRNFTRENTVEPLKSCSAFILEHQNRFGEDASVRIRTDILFGSRDGVGISDREFRILAAIYSAIGNKPFTEVALSWIQYRAAGCKSKAVFNQWTSRGEVYTPKQIRASVEKLHNDGKGFFARATFKNSATYYSNRMDGPELRQAIIDLHLQRRNRKKSEGSADAEMNATYDRLSAEITGGPPGKLEAS